MKKLILAAALWTASAQAIPLVNGGVVTLSQSPTMITINGGSGSQKVQRLSVRVIPGYTCKVYVGSLGHSRSTYAGVYSVLYPNWAGGWSEEFTVEDPRGTDGINLALIAISGDCAGEQVNVMYLQTGNLSSSVLRLFNGTLLTPPAGQTATLWGGSTTLAALVRVQVVPGYTGKIRFLGQQGFEVATLWPNVYGDNRSERFQVVDQFSSLRPDLMYIKADVGGEGALVLLGTYF